MMMALNHSERSNQGIHMKKFWGLLCAAAICSTTAYAAGSNVAKVQMNQPAQQSRWKEYAQESNGNKHFYDRLTVKPEVQDLLNNPSGLPVIIHAWTKVQYKNGTMTEPQHFSLDCRFKENLQPDSPTEKLYNTLCLHPATLKAVDDAINLKKSELTQNISSELERKRNAQQLNEAQTRQYQAQQMNSMVQNSLWQGVGLVNSFRR